MYNKEEQRLMVLEMLRQSSQQDRPYTKQQNFERAVSFALDEINELEQQFNQFMSRVSHLEVFQDAVKEPLTTDMNKMIQNLRYLVEKNYTKEEKEKMPENVLNQIRVAQERRVELLKRIARRYLSRSK